MKVAVMSDLHLEFCDIDIANSKNADVLILSGDIGLAEPLKDFPSDRDYKKIESHRHDVAIRFRRFFKRCCERFPNVIYVAGNHEFYHGKFFQTLDILKEESSVYKNLHFLENKSVQIEDVIFVGGTLWTDCNKSNPLSSYQISRSMNDFNIIRNDRAGYRKLTPLDTIVRHKETLEYIQCVVANAPKTTKIVVVTHHAPSFMSVDEQYKDDVDTNGAYASDLSEFILENPNIVLWTHGHMHNFSNYMLGSTRIVCNPRGYVTYSAVEMTHWDQNFTLDI